MTVLVGNTEKRVVYKNFELNNLHQNVQDYSHTNYEYYLENNYFLPPGEGQQRKYWAHTKANLVPTNASTTQDKGLFNMFPLDLVPLDAKHTTASSLGKRQLPPPPVCSSAWCVCVDLFFLHTGVISTSPLKLELEFEPVLPNTCTWYLCCTYQYLSRIQFSGNKLKQDVTYAYL